MRNQLVEQVKMRIKQRFPNLKAQEIDTTFDMAVSDYLAIKYPSDNNRPNIGDLNYDFFNTQWIFKRMIDILERAGINLKSYSENGLSFEYANGNIDPVLVAQLMPKASVPK